MTYQLFGREAHDFRKYLVDESKRKGGILIGGDRENKVDVYHFADAILEVRDLRGGVGIELTFEGERSEEFKSILEENTSLILATEIK